MQRFLVLLSLSLLLSVALKATGNASYLGYYDLINAAEEAYVINKDTTACFADYDKAFSSVSRPFIKDYYIAAEIACHSGSRGRMLRYLDA